MLWWCHTTRLLKNLLILQISSKYCRVCLVLDENLISHEFSHLPEVTSYSKGIHGIVSIMLIEAWSKIHSRLIKISYWKKVCFCWTIPKYTILNTFNIQCSLCEFALIHNWRLKWWNYIFYTKKNPAKKKKNTSTLIQNRKGFVFIHHPMLVADWTQCRINMREIKKAC